MKTKHSVQVTSSESTLNSLNYASSRHNSHKVPSFIYAKPTSIAKQTNSGKKIIKDICTYFLALLEILCIEFLAYIDSIISMSNMRACCSNIKSGTFNFIFYLLQDNLKLQHVFQKMFFAKDRSSSKLFLSYVRLQRLQTFFEGIAALAWMGLQLLNHHFVIYEQNKEKFLHLVGFCEAQSAYAVGGGSPRFVVCSVAQKEHLDRVVFQTLFTTLIAKRFSKLKPVNKATVSWSST